MNDPGLNGRCPVDVAIDVVGGKWKPLILHRLGAGTLRFGQLQRAIAPVTQRMLTLQLRELERDGLVLRTVYAQVPPKVEYTLSAPARSLLPVLESLGRWLLAHQGELRKARPAPNADGGGWTTRRAAATDRRAGRVADSQETPPK